jgi:hypothetical protein
MCRRQRAPAALRRIACCVTHSDAGLRTRRLTATDADAPAAAATVTVTVTVAVAVAVAAVTAARDGEAAAPNPGDSDLVRADVVDAAAATLELGT